MVLNKVWIFPIYYDPMLAKLITYGETRGIEIMINAIDNYLVEGVQTTCFWKYVMEHDAFRSGYYFVSITM
jgi:acetyl/propionyl-CoA carboxylase alpha subunit